MISPGEKGIVLYDTASRGRLDGYPFAEKYYAPPQRWRNVWSDPPIDEIALAKDTKEYLNRDVSAFRLHNEGILEVA